MRARRVPEDAICIVDSLNHDGCGVGHRDGKVVFIDGALPGEEVRFRYLGRRNRYDTGAVQEVLVPSPQRRDARCAHFGVCGGCRLQHLEPHAQLVAKEGIVREAFAHIARLDCPDWAAPVAGPVFGYRRKARLGARVVDKKGGLLLGFRERRHSYIAPLAYCHTLDARLGARLCELKALIDGLSARDAIPQIEFASGDEAAALVVRHLRDLSAADCRALAAFGEIHGFAMYTQAGGPETVRSVGGADETLRYALPEFDVKLAFGPTDFIQVNGETNKAMVAQAVDWLELSPTDHMLDLFCGLGNFTLPMARRAGLVFGVEGVSGLIDRARGNARDNGIDNARFAVADLDAPVLAELLGDLRFDAALLDPPRTGAMIAVQALAAHGVRRIVYVSCNPATLARDAQWLVHRGGYRLARAGVVDMFPQTHHVEAMALFTRDA
ncbi:23S rRNA (uracil(1939)-C(5))-methyltransferase RlmD [Acidiferrobacter sp.]|uniref:23S rRNA (uracil(1939)-C(5))-methyltransferase RlmD n=1 Tax=Acidiferrobacter sp. TaxID=1872107 RepID=UPI00263A2D12|nr:23S rRNA (uracil(1939)-C(5))-methyltransferase RlmD [Acidiferrobacter sp.]